MASKRVIIPEGDTPGKPVVKSRRGGDSRRSLFPSKIPILEQRIREKLRGKPWADIEMKALVQYVALFSDADSWPVSRNKEFWSKCASYISEQSNCQVRSWSGVLTQVQKNAKGDSEQYLKLKIFIISTMNWTRKYPVKDVVIALKHRKR